MRRAAGAPPRLMELHVPPPPLAVTRPLQMTSLWRGSPSATIDSDRLQDAYALASALCQWLKNRVCPPPESEPRWEFYPRNNRPDYRRRSIRPNVPSARRDRVRNR